MERFMITERKTYLKWNLAGDIDKMTNEILTKEIREQRTRQDALRNRGLPPTRWTDDIKRVTINWIHVA